MTLRRAAPLLDLSEQALRARIGRAVRRAPPGDVPIPIGLGAVARRLGGHWRVRLPDEVDHG